MTESQSSAQNEPSTPSTPYENLQHSWPYNQDVQRSGRYNGGSGSSQANHDAVSVTSTIRDGNSSQQNLNTSSGQKISKARDEPHERSGLFGGFSTKKGKRPSQ
jgi:hypothetical protein